MGVFWNDVFMFLRGIVDCFVYMWPFALFSLSVVLKLSLKRFIVRVFVSVAMCFVFCLCGSSQCVSLLLL